MPYRDEEAAEPTVPHCFVCKTNDSDTLTLQRCTKCRHTNYCSSDCQRKDWSKHKAICKPESEALWYDKFRGPMDDKSFHFGTLELITWEWTNEYADRLGSANVFIAEANDMRKILTEKCGGDEERFHAYWPQAFRWSCCGLDDSMAYGCDHHGTGPKPCSCDFCRTGKPLPDNIFNKDGTRRGLTLARGPDPRSFNLAIGAIAAMGRSVAGMDSE